MWKGVEEPNPGVRQKKKTLLLMAAVMTASVAACAAPWDAPRGSLDAPPGQGMARMQFSPHMERDVDPMLLDARAEDMQRVVEETRAHVAELRTLSGDNLSSRMMGHTAQVARVQSVVTRHTTDMVQRFGLDEEAIAAHFGMQPVEYRAFMKELGAVREEAGRLQVEIPSARERALPSHLERLEAVVGRIEAGALRMVETRR